MTDGTDARARRWRMGVGWVGALFFAAVAVVASAHLLVDAWQVVTRIGSLAALREFLVAMAVIAAGVALTFVIARLASSGPRQVTLAIVAALVTLVAVRIAVAIAYDGGLSGESGVYDRQAADLLAGECCPWDQPVGRPPGYSAMLAGAYAVLGRSAFAGEALNIAFAVATGLIVFELARGLYGAQSGAIALLLYALWPAGALMIAVRMPHGAYELAFAAAAWTVLASPRGWRGSALGGIALGLSQYLRPTTFLLLPAFMVARAWGEHRLKGAIGATVLPMSLAFLLVMVPVMAWHVSTRGVLDISTSAYGGSSLYHGTNVDSGGRWSEPASRELTAIAGSDQWQRTKVGQELAIRRLLADPLAMLALAIRKQDTLWGAETYGVRYGIRRELATRPYLPRSVLPSLASGAFYAALLALTAVGLFIRRRQTDALSALVILATLSVSLAHGLLEVRDRYHAYLVPLLMPITALTVAVAINRLGRSQAEAEPEETPVLA